MRTRTRAATAAAALAGLVASATAMISAFAPAAHAADPWWSSNEAGDYRSLITVSGNGTARTDKPVDIAFPAPIPSFDANSLRVVETNSGGDVIDANVPFQYDGGGSPHLIFIAGGSTGASSSRRFYAYYDTAAKGIAKKNVTARVSVADDNDGNDDVFKVTTPAATYWYQKAGASFSKIVDSDGNDWISFHDENPQTAGGFFRGAPNFHFPQGNFHPGFQNSSTSIVSQGPLKIVLRSTSSVGGTFDYQTSFYPGYAESTVLQATSTQVSTQAGYWWLYEGTPGGERGVGDNHARTDFKVIRGNSGTGSETDAVTIVGGKLPAGDRWTHFRVPNMGTTYGRSLFMAHAQDDGDEDAYYLAGETGSETNNVTDGYMTVFGFGRAGATMSLNGSAQNTFYLGLMQPTSAQGAADTIRNAYKPLSTVKGSVEQKGSITPPPPQGTEGQFVPVTPYRLLDTRTTGTPIAANTSFGVSITGLPVSASSVVMNITVTESTEAGFITAYAAGESLPSSSNLNFVAGQTIANSVTSKIGALGKVLVYNSAGNSHVIIDVLGYYSDGTVSEGGRFHPLSPVRVVDTRQTNTPVGTTSINVDMSTVAGVNAAHLAGVAINLTSTGGSGDGYIAAYPTGGSVPATSSVNFLAGKTQPNLVLVKTGTAGKISLVSNVAKVDAIVDIVGWFDDGDASVTSSGYRYQALTSPTRFLDTRSDPGTPVGSGLTVAKQIGGALGVTSGAKAALMNVTAVDPTEGGFLTVYPSDVTAPLASTVNFVRGDRIPNAAIAKLSGSGSVTTLNSAGNTHVLIDVAGVFV